MIIDANIITGYYIEVALGKPTSLTGSSVYIFEAISCTKPIFIDDEDQIEGEWRTANNNEWFDAWFGDLLLNNHIQYVTASNLPLSTMTKLKKFGFPNSRDIWYIRTAQTVSLRKGQCYLKTEDLDFFYLEEESIQRKAQNKNTSGSKRTCS